MGTAFVLDPDTLHSENAIGSQKTATLSVLLATPNSHEADFQSWLQIMGTVARREECFERDSETVCKPEIWGRRGRQSSAAHSGIERAAQAIPDEVDRQRCHQDC